MRRPNNWTSSKRQTGCGSTRMQAEANLASEFASKLAAARSLPEAMFTCQDWGKRRIEMMAEDTKHLLDDTQTFIQIGAQLLTKTWQGKRPGASS